MGAAPGATPRGLRRTRSADSAPGTGCSGSLGGGAGGGTPMAAMNRSSARPPPVMTSPASDDLLGAILGDEGGSAPGSDLGSGTRFVAELRESDFSVAGGSTRVEPAGTSTLASSLGGSASDLGTASGGGLGVYPGWEARSRRGEARAIWRAAARPRPRTGSLGSGISCLRRERRARFDAARPKRDRRARRGLRRTGGPMASAQPSRTVSRTASANDFTSSVGDGAGASPSVSSPDASGTAADGGSGTGLEDFLSQARPSDSPRHAAPPARIHLARRGA